MADAHEERALLNLCDARSGPCARAAPWTFRSYGDSKLSRSWTMAGHGGVCGEHGLVPAAADESSRISSSSAANATISSSSVEPGVLSDGGAPSSGAAGGPAPAPDVGSAAWREACPALDRWGFELPAGGGGSPGPHSGGEEQARAS